MPLSLRCIVSISLAVFAFSIARADDTSDKQKASAIENLKKSGIAKSAIVETTNLIVTGSLPELRTKAVAAGLEKVYAAARRSLQFAADEQPWPGKLTVYLFTDRQPFSLFMLQVAGERAKESTFISPKGDDSFVAINIDGGEKKADADIAADAGRLVAMALLGAKGDMAKFPEWIRAGFGRAAVARADGPTSRRMNELRSKAKAAFAGGKGKPPAGVDDVWDSARTADTDVLEASFMDFLAFGPNAADLEKFLGGFRPSEGKLKPTLDKVLEGMMWKAEDLEKAWKKHVQSGK